MFKIIVCAVTVLALGDTLSLPDYITACHLSDPNLKQCRLDSARKAIPIISKGDKKYGIVNLNPMLVPEVMLQSENLKITFRELEIYGMPETQVNDLDIDLENLKGSINCFAPLSVYKGKYEIDGQIMVLPIKGQGDAEIKLIGGNFTVHFDLEKFNKNGEEYVKIANPKVDYSLKKSEYALNNLFNGNERLGTEMNKLLNENWEAVNAEMQPSVSKILGEICFNIVNGYFTRIPLKTIMPA